MPHVCRIEHFRNRQALCVPVIEKVEISNAIDQLKALRGETVEGHNIHWICPICEAESILMNYSAKKYPAIR